MIIGQIDLKIDVIKNLVTSFGCLCHSIVERFCEMLLLFSAAMLRTVKSTTDSDCHPG